MSALSTSVAQGSALAANESNDGKPGVSQAAVLAATKSTDTAPRTSQVHLLASYGPIQTQYGRESQQLLLAATAAQEGNVTTTTSQALLLAAYGTGVPNTKVTNAWTFVLDGHRFYVLSLGPEGDWAYDMTTQEWCQLKSTGLPGLNFTHGVMWGIRIIGGDAQYNNLYEMDPTQAFDEGWREVQHMVTGGIPIRTRSVVGVANFTLTASVGDDNAIDQSISLAFSDDNGVTWSQEFPIPLTDVGSQKLIWNALGSFTAPGRVFRITDYSGPVRLDGADAVLTVGSGADSGQDTDGQKAP